MVILGGLELVAAGYLLKEMHNDKKEEEERERDRERRRRRRHHSREDRHRPHRHDDSSPERPSRPQQPQQHLYPPQHPGGPPRPYSAPPPQNRPQMVPGAAMGAAVGAAVAAPMWHPPPQHMPNPAQARPQTNGTWTLQQQQRPPQQPQQMQQPPQQQMQQRPGQWQGPPPNQPNATFVPPPLQRPATAMYPPPGVHIDMKTGKIQHDMYPPEMRRDDSPPPARRRETGKQEYERVRESKTSSKQTSQLLPYAEQGYTYSQPQISVTPAPGPVHSYSFPAASPPQGFAELDSETPGRYRPQSNEKASYPGSPGRGKSHSFSSRYADEDMELRDPPPAYREY